MGDTDPDVTVVVVTWQRRELVLACLASIVEQTVPCRVIVVDNASDDGTDAAIESRYPQVELVRLATNTGFAGGMSAGLARVQTRFVAMLNNDAVAEPDWLAASMTAFSDDVVAVTAKLLLDDTAGMDGSDGSSTGTPSTPQVPVLNNAGVLLLDTGYGADRGLGEPDDGRAADRVEVFGFSGGAAVLRTLAVQAVGGFPPSFFMYYEDTDLSWRLRLAGWRVVYEPTAVVHHRHAESSDVRSPLFAYYNERNRLVTLVRNAPVRVVLGASTRFAVTTASLALKTLMAPAPPQAVFDPALRVRVARGVLARLPAALAQRLQGPRLVPRAAVWSEWAGVTSRPLPGSPL